MSAQPMMPVIRPENRTNVRTQIVRFVLARGRVSDLAARQVLRLSERWPDATARALEPLFFKTMRRPMPDWERAVLKTGRRFGVGTPFGTLPAWSFGEGPAVVLMHGWNGRGSQLAAFVDPLVKRGHQVVLFDAPGHGAAPGWRSSLVDFADALDIVVDAVRPMFGPVHAIVAHSMGGAAVTYAMHRRLQQPTTRIERGLRTHKTAVEKFVFIAPPVDVRDFVRAGVKLFGGGPDLERAMRARIQTKFGLELEKLYAPTLAREMDAPLLVIHDEKDKEVPLERGRLLADSWPDAELEVTSGLGHMRILKDASVIDRVAEFVG